MWDWLTHSRAELLVAGGLGGLIRWITLRESLANGLLSIASGAIFASYLAPFARPALAWLFTWLDLPDGMTPSDGSEFGLAGFIMGIAGLSVSGFVLDVLKARRQRLRDGK